MRMTYPTATVLHALASGHVYGFEIVDVTGLGAGTVYPILRRLEHGSYVRSRWEAAPEARAEGRPPRRNYTLTATGEELVRETEVRYPMMPRLFERDGEAPA